ncbi:MAG: GNAT family N-acetyltransferase [Alphaproteobacteria bacterium]|nr:GNAT family N-acetyltransferase [Alphaproteobacteria bacterium]
MAPRPDAALLRPFLPDDVPILVAIFTAAIEELTGDDYSEAQQEAWIASIEDEAAFGQRLGKQLTLIALLAEAPVGFASLRGTDHIDMLYVYPEVAGRGVATSLVDALEKLSAHRGAVSLSVDASDTAVGFFARRGYQASQRNSVMRGGEWLANTTMCKMFGSGSRASGSPSE